jgi:hypothetical protein
MLISGKVISELNLDWCAPKPRVLGVAYLVLGETVTCNVFLPLFFLGLDALYFAFLLFCTNLLYIFILSFNGKNKNIGRGFPYCFDQKKSCAI